MSWHPRHQRTLFINPIAESLLQLTPRDSCLSLAFTNTDPRESICRMIAFWRRHQHQLNSRSLAHHAFDQAQQRSFTVRSHQHSLQPQTFDECSQVRCRVVPRTLPVNNCRSQASNPIVSACDTKDRQHIFSVTTEEAIVNANVPQLSFLSGRMCVRSTLRRNTMATPASVHCMSRQLVFGDLSCTGLKRKTWHPRHHKHFTIHRIISHWIVCSSCSPWVFWIWVFWSYRFGSSWQPPEEDSGIASVLFPFGFMKMLNALFSLCTQLCNHCIVNPSSLSGSTHRFSSQQQSSLCGTGNLSHHTN